MRRTAPLLSMLLLLALAACGDATGPAAALRGVASISAGGDHTCAITTGGEALCWGRGSTGALGGGSAVGSPSPVRVSGGAALAAVSAGDEHSCALTAAGGIDCWGAGGRGQTGTGTRDSADVPTAVIGGPPFLAVSAGGEHTCALGGDSLLYCWGRADHGELGNASLADSAAPGAPGGYAFHYREVSAGGHHGCALTNDRVVRCWGWDRYGQLGVGSRVGLGLPEAIHAAGLRFSTVSAGAEHTCALTTDGVAYCWGRADSGQLGIGSTPDDVLEPTAVAGGLVFASISAGAEHTCALTADGRAYCWGRNTDGRLGTGTTTGVEASPVAVVGNLRFQQVSAGGLHTCAVSLDGSAYCWGFGGFGQLGTGTTLDHAEPTPVGRP